MIVWGATGFTGRLVARYLCERYGASGPVRWAIAGRREHALEELRSELTEIDSTAADLPMLIGDSNDAESLRQMAAQTMVMLTTVGPYSAYGAELVAACVAEGTDYVDLCGETPFIRRMIDEHHETAREQRCRIVHCCGFDSVPSDIGVLHLQKTAMDTLGTTLPTVRFYLEKAKGGLSGGTLASMMGIMDQARDRSVRRLLGNPYALNPDDGVRGPDGSDQTGVQWDPLADAWTAPFMMAGINTRVVRRSNALLDYAWGQDFAYSEVVALKSGAGGWCRAMQMAVGLGSFMALTWARPTRALLKATVLPKPGQGPSPKAQETGFFRIRLVGQGDAGRLETVIRGKRDPGYGATSRMLAESALCLAFDQDQLPERYGVLTPSSGIGEALIPRLTQIDITFEQAASAS